MISYSNYLHDGRVHRYSQSLIQEGYRVDTIGLGFKGDTRKVEMDGVTVFRIQNRDFSESGPLSYFFNLIIFFLKSLIFSTKMHMKHRYDVIHFHNIPDFGVFCTLIVKWMGASIILDIHDLVPEFYRRKFNVSEKHIIIKMLRLLEQWSCRYADHVITVTDIWKDTLINRSLRNEKCSVIMNLPLSNVFKPIPYVSRKNNESFNLSYHGNLAEQTGVDLLLDALALIVEQAPRIKLQIIGEGRMRTRLQEKSISLGLADCVQFLPLIPVKELPRYMDAIHAAVDPKRDGVYAGETLSVKAMEYLSMRIPLIVSKTMAASLYFDTDTVCFVEPNNSEAIARAILDLYQNEPLRKNLHLNAKKFNDQYNWTSMKTRYLQIIHKLVYGEVN